MKTYILFPNSLLLIIADEQQQDEEIEFLFMSLLLRIEHYAGHAMHLAGFS